MSARALLGSLILGCAMQEPDSRGRGTAKQAAPWSAPDGDGAYAVGALSMSWTDSRGKALVAEVWYPASPEDGATPEPYPPLVLGGDQDGVLDYETEIRPSWAAMSQPKTLASFHWAGHYAFSNICTLAPFFTEECEEEAGGWINLATAQDLSRTMVLAHIALELLGDDRYAPWTAEQLARDHREIAVE